MISRDCFSRVRTLWPLFERAGRNGSGHGKLLLALAWEQSGLDPSLEGLDGARGLLQMSEHDAEEVARQLGVPRYDLSDAVVAVLFGMVHLRRELERFSLPRLAVAACLVGAEAVQAAGGQVPRVPEVQRRVRDVMVTWHWIVCHLDEVLRAPAEPPERPPEAPVSGAEGNGVVLPPARTRTASRSGRTVLEARPWRVELGGAGPLWVPQGLLSTLEGLAGGLGLCYQRDDEVRQIRLALPMLPPPATGRLIVPVPGANASHNGEYSGAHGLDLLVAHGSPVVAVGSGRIEAVTESSLLLRLDRPFEYQGKAFPFVRLSGLWRVQLREHGRAVRQGETLGWSGTTDRVPQVRLTVSRDAAGEQTVCPHVLAAYFGWVVR